MGVRVRQKEKGEGKPWWIFIAYKGQRKSLLVGDKRAAEALASRIRERIKAGGLQLNRGRNMKVITRFGKRTTSYIADYIDPFTNKRKRKFFSSIEEAEEMLKENKKLSERRLWAVLSAVYELGGGVNQKTIADNTGLLQPIVSRYVRKAIDQGLMENANEHNLPNPFSLKVTEKGVQYLAACRQAEDQPPETAPYKGTSLEGILNEIILRQTRTIERLLEEYERFKQENERLTQREKQLMADNDKWLEDNLKL
jgi:DNA-binding MarR family transcriptional regulator